MTYVKFDDHKKQVKRIYDKIANVNGVSLMAT